jgi:hypothetical protein
LFFPSSVAIPLQKVLAMSRIYLRNSGRSSGARGVRALRRAGRGMNRLLALLLSRVDGWVWRSAQAFSESL